MAEDPSDRARLKLGFLGDLPMSEIHPADVEVWEAMHAEELRRNPEKAERLRDAAQTFDHHIRRPEGEPSDQDPNSPQPE